MKAQTYDNHLLKVKDKEILDKYNNPTIFQFFPGTNTRILLVGKPRLDNLKKSKKHIKTTIPGNKYKIHKYLNTRVAPSGKKVTSSPKI